MKKSIYWLVIASFMLSGCTLVLQKGRRTDIEKIELLESQLAELKNARDLLKERLSEEIADKQVRLEIAKRGLIITFVAEVLFDSGKAKLRKESYPILDKVVAVLKEKVPENEIGIEGHTDNEPIKYSRWNTNWELSAQRALSVLYYLEKEGIPSDKLSAVGYGEYRPIASNATAEGKQFNRRVEIVVLPRTSKVKDETDDEEEEYDYEYEEEEIVIEEEEFK